LKKQGMLALTFDNKEDYNKILEDDIIDITGLTEFTENKPLGITLHHKDGTTYSFKVNHTYNAPQIEWFKAGGALNIIRKEFAARN
jgi:aconitate hydratase